jgi:hypothetical protein
MLALEIIWIDRYITMSKGKKSDGQTLVHHALRIEHAAL